MTTKRSTTRKKKGVDIKGNLRTTVTGLLTAGLLGYAGYSQGNPEMMLAAASLATMGILAKDAK